MKCVSGRPQHLRYRSAIDYSEGKSLLENRFTYLSGPSRRRAPAGKLRVAKLRSVGSYGTLNWRDSDGHMHTAQMCTSKCLRKT